MTKLLSSYILLVIVVAALPILLILPGELQHMESNLEQMLSRTVYILAYDKEIIEGLEAGAFPPHLRQRLDGILKQDNSSIDYLVVADTKSIRLYHPDPGHIGEKFTGGDEADALEGRKGYITTWLGDPDVQKRAFHAVRNEQGEVIGFVMASTSMKNVEMFKRQIQLHALEFFVIALMAGIFLAWGISRNIRHILLGYTPTAFARMYLQREELLDILSEGILIVDRENTVLYRNPAAFAYVGNGKLPTNFPLQPGILEAFRTNTPVPWYMVELGGESFLANIVPLHPLEQQDAVMVILRNRTEFVRMSEQLTGMNHIIDALRANTHEFRNKIHVLYGLLQLGEVDQAISFLSDEAQGLADRHILRLIEDKTVAALLLGKANRAKEINIDFYLRSDSRLPQNNPYLTTKELVTILGNLLENAFEAIGNEGDVRQVEFFIRSEPEGMTVTVDDTGCGMTEEQIQSILAGSYTTKGAGHGYGMRLVQEIVKKHDGFLQIDSDPGTGTSITISINGKKDGRAADDKDSDCRG